MYYRKLVNYGRVPSYCVWQQCHVLSFSALLVIQLLFNTNFVLGPFSGFKVVHALTYMSFLRAGNMCSSSLALYNLAEYLAWRECLLSGL